MSALSCIIKKNVRLTFLLVVHLCDKERKRICLLETYEEKLQVRVTRKLKAKAKKVAKKRGIPLSRLLRIALINELRKEEYEIRD